MGTHSVIGVKTPDGKITGCYVHYDGYEDHMIPAIKDYISKFTTTGLFSTIANGQRLGGIRTFHGKGIHDEVYRTEFFDDSPYVIDENNFYDDHAVTYAWYLIDYNTGEIHVEGGDEEWES